MYSKKQLEEVVENARQGRSFDWETSDFWRLHVSDPVVMCNMAPRQARAVLMLAGSIFDMGGDPLTVLEDMVRRLRIHWNGQD